jgi:hypothetical protein
MTMVQLGDTLRFDTERCPPTACPNSKGTLPTTRWSVALFAGRDALTHHGTQDGPEGRAPSCADHARGALVRYGAHAHVAPAGEPRRELAEEASAVSTGEPRTRTPQIGRDLVSWRSSRWTAGLASCRCPCEPQYKRLVHAALAWPAERPIGTSDGGVELSTATRSPAGRLSSEAPCAST